MPQVNLPSFYEDESYKSTQEKLSGLGTGLISGDIPEYYKGIGESGGEQYQDMLRGVTGDITREVTEDVARRRGRGGAGTYSIAKNVGDISSRLGYSDLLRSLKGRESLLQSGIGTLEGVGSRGLQYGGQQNQFSLNKAGLEFRMNEAEEARKDQEENAWMDFLSSGIGAVGNIIGMRMTGGLSSESSQKTTPSKSSSVSSQETTPSTSSNVSSQKTTPSTSSNSGYWNQDYSWL